MTFFSIVGTTAVGKTSFALWAAEEILKQTSYAGVDLISADSRQVYRGLEIISGADIPQNLPDEIELHGIVMIEPDEEWSVAHFQEFAQPILEKAKTENRLVLIVGGTGLYHQQLLNPEIDLDSGPDEEIRAKADAMDLTTLQAWAKETDAAAFNQLNQSDVSNPRRLIRLIERSQSSSQVAKSLPNFEQHYLGLRMEFELIEEKIKQRVMERFETGAQEEVEKLIAAKLDSALPALSATGVKEVWQFLAGNISREECLRLWTTAEVQYAKRQLTWWKKRTIEWFDLGQPEWKQRALAYILSLCSTSSEETSK